MLEHGVDKELRYKVEDLSSEGEGHNRKARSNRYYIECTEYRFARFG